jgi:ABC-type uncharacterized transport system substrate-binding protein
LLQTTRTVPVVFPTAADPVAAGFVDSLARLGGNATDFMDLEYGMAGKWLELLKQIASGVTRVAVLGDPATPTGPVARDEVNPVNVRDASDIERAIGAVARFPNGGPDNIVALLGFGSR